jgi:hypothetical protein
LQFVVILFAVCMAVPAHGAEKGKKYLELGVAPVEPGRMVNWAAGECILRLEHDELATITYARGGISSGWLRRGTAVVVDRDGVARWIYHCGNTVVEPRGWKPKGTLECGPSLREGNNERRYDERPAYLPKEENGGTWTLVDSGDATKATPRTIKRKDPNKKWYFVAAGILALGVAGAYCTSPSGECWQNGGGGSNPPDPGGGPAPDPPN